MVLNSIKTHQALQSLLAQQNSSILRTNKIDVDLFTDNEIKNLNIDVSNRFNNQSKFQTFSGSDIKAVMYLPLLTKNSHTLDGAQTKKFKVFADLQTISISSTRSVSPVRVFGRSSPIGYTRGARTFAGSLVFATIRKDPFVDVADADVAESFVNASSSLIADQLPPFSVVITASNETGAAAIQIIHGITITNYGTVYSVDDLYTETTYTYVATDVQVLVPGTVKARPTAAQQEGYNNITKLVQESLGTAYGTVQQLAAKAYKIASTAYQLPTRP